MKEIIFKNSNKLYIIDLNSDFLILFFINIFKKNRVNLHQINPKIIKMFKYKNVKKVSTIMYPVLIAFSISIGNILNDIQSPTIFVVNNFAIICIIFLIWITLAVSRIVIYKLLMKKRIIEITKENINGYIHISNNSYILKFLFLKIMIVLSYIYIYFCLLEGTLFKIFLVVGVIVFIGWIKKIQWNLFEIEFDDGRTVYPVSVES